MRTDARKRWGISKQIFGDFTLGFQSMDRWENVENQALADVAQDLFHENKRSVVIALPREEAA